MTDAVAEAEVTISAPTTKVWQALTDPSMIKQYMGGANVKTDWKVGSPITYEGEWDGKAYQDKGEILEVVENKRLKSTHYSPMSGEPDVPENYHIVTYDLTDNGDTTALRVTQENNPSEEMVQESEKTWSMMLNGIKDLVEG